MSMLRYLMKKNFNIQNKFLYGEVFCQFAIFDSWDWSPYDSAAAAIKYKGTQLSKEVSALIVQNRFQNLWIIYRISYSVP